MKSVHEIVAHMRKEFPRGTRIQLDAMDDPQAPPAGTRGTVNHIDDAGNLLVQWDNGSSLNAIWGIDQFHRIKEEKRFYYSEMLRKVRLMPMIVIYDHPTDYPNHYVARVWDIDKPTGMMIAANTLEEIRESIPRKHMKCIGRRPEDDPHIVEVWI